MRHGDSVFSSITYEGGKVYFLQFCATWQQRYVFNNIREDKGCFRQFYATWRQRSVVNIIREGNWSFLQFCATWQQRYVFKTIREGKGAFFNVVRHLSSILHERVRSAFFNFVRHGDSVLSPVLYKRASSSFLKIK